tara:strand:- start:1074 stop:2642 length:1569 start_codon:yes stop_codon:yes gene_type:complete
LREVYLNSSIYDKKISIVESKSLIYKPTLSILSCLIKYDKKKQNIEDFDIETIWNKRGASNGNFVKLQNFFWLFSIDLKSSSKLTQSIIEKWIDRNQKYKNETWKIDILSKRVIAWISNSILTYEDANRKYKNKIDNIINKQINHLLLEIERSNSVDDKLLGCTAIILSGISYKNERFLNFGLKLLKKIISSSFDNSYFPRSRSIRQLVFYLKYFVLIRELLKESLSNIPDYLDEIIFYLGKSFDLLSSSNQSLLFNGNHISDQNDFKKYLSRHKYKFLNTQVESGGYAFLKDKNSMICMDIGPSPIKKFSDNYQSGTLSFEFFYKNEKIICNSGYFQNYKKKLNVLSKSSAVHSTLILDNKSICSFNIAKNKKSLLEKGVKVFEKEIENDKNIWAISSSHDGYVKNYGVIHCRKLNYDTKNLVLKGKDILKKKNNFKKSNFNIRFHFMPNAKITKTYDNNTVLIELEHSGWKFNSSDGLIDIESGLFFGNKNRYQENLNINLSGITTEEEQIIKWELIKIS